MTVSIPARVCDSCGNKTSVYSAWAVTLSDFDGEAGGSYVLCDDCAAVMEQLIYDGGLKYVWGDDEEVDE